MYVRPGLSSRCIVCEEMASRRTAPTSASKSFSNHRKHGALHSFSHSGLGHAHDRHRLHRYIMPRRGLHVRGGLRRGARHGSRRRRHWQDSKRLTRQQRICVRNLSSEVPFPAASSPAAQRHAGRRDPSALTPATPARFQAARGAAAHRCGAAHVFPSHASSHQCTPQRRPRDAFGLSPVPSNLCRLSRLPS